MEKAITFEGLILIYESMNVKKYDLLLAVK